MQMHFLKNKFLLKKYSLIYLATPYSKYPQGHEEAWLEACRIAAVCVKEGIHVFSPISHSHGPAVYGNMGTGYDTWKVLDGKFMDLCDAILVVQMPGWNDSVGVRDELNTFRVEEKPVYFMTWPKLEIYKDDYAEIRRRPGPSVAYWR